VCGGRSFTLGCVHATRLHVFVGHKWLARAALDLLLL
jgi:hypothetical protein